LSDTLRERLAHPEPEVRAAACLAAPEDPNGALYLEMVCAALADPDSRVGRAASRSLVQSNRRGGGVPPLVRAVLRGPVGSRGRLLAALTLAQLETPSPELLPALVEGLLHSDGPLRWEAARTLVDVGRLHTEAVTLLVGLVASGESPLLRRMAMHCLRELAPDLPEAASALVGASRDANPALVRAALTAMAGLFRPPSAVLERLEQAREDPDPAARLIAERALQGYRDEPDCVGA
jgi:HEAT repeat protein